MTDLPIVLGQSRDQSSQRDDDHLYLGGEPWLPTGTGWPTCVHCEVPQTFYLHLAMPEGTSWEGRAINVFGCTATCNRLEVVPDGFRGYNTGATIPVPPGYLRDYGSFFRFVVVGPTARARVSGAGVRLQFVRLEAKRAMQAAGRGLRIGGEPSLPRSWPSLEVRLGTNGEPAPFLFQIPRGQRFQALPEVPPQASLANRQRVLMGEEPLSDYELFSGGALWAYGLETELGPMVWGIPGPTPTSGLDRGP